MAHVAGVDEHVGPAGGRHHEAGIGLDIQVLSRWALQLASLSSQVQLKSILAPAPGMHSVPELAVEANRLFALPGHSVVDRVCGVAAAGVIDGEVSLQLVALVQTSLASEVVDLPPLAHSSELRTLIEVGIPLSTNWAGRQLAKPSSRVEQRHVREALAGVVIREVSVVDFAANLALF